MIFNRWPGEPRLGAPLVESRSVGVTHTGGPGSEPPRAQQGGKTEEGGRGQPGRRQAEVTGKEEGSPRETRRERKRRKRKAREKTCGMVIVS